MKLKYCGCDYISHTFLYGNFLAIRAMLGFNSFTRDLKARQPKDPLKKCLPRASLDYWNLRQWSQISYALWLPRALEVKLDQILILRAINVTLTWNIVSYDIRLTPFLNLRPALNWPLVISAWTYQVINFSSFSQILILTVFWSFLQIAATESFEEIKLAWLS